MRLLEAAMNGTPESSLCESKRAISPRPQTVGEEFKVTHDSSGRLPETCKDRLRSMEHEQESSERLQRHSADEETLNPSPPPPYKWAQSLLCLLEDIQGVNLFQQFLEQEGQDTRSLKFWFACRGVKRADPSDREGLRRLIKLIFDKKVSRIPAVSAATKEEIKQKLSSGVGVDDTIFDGAQSEVEEYMMKTTYPNFLRSDIYIRHLGIWQSDSVAEKDAVVTPEPPDLLPTVHEDSELQISSANKALLTRENLLQRSRISTNSRLKLEGPAQLYLKSPYGNYSCYHSKYSSFLPASAQDSELQSLSSDAQTDDTMSVTDSGIEYSSYSKSKQKRQAKAAKHNASQNKDRLSHNTFIPRTQRLPDSMHQYQTPQEFVAILCKKLNKVIEERKANEKINERLRIIQSNEYFKQEQNSVPNQRTCHKANAPPVFDPSFPCNLGEDNGQDILDQHVSRVWNDTPTCSSPGFVSPPAARGLCEPPRDLSHYEPPHQDLTCGALQKMNQTLQVTVLHASRHRKDHDTHSRDSCVTYDYYSDDRFSGGHGGPSSLGSTDPVDCSQSRRFREQLKRNTSKKFSSTTDSGSSCVDSGISLACQSVPPSNSKVTHWLETNRCNSDQDKEQSWKNSSTSPVLSRSSSSRKAVAYNGSWLGTSESSGAPRLPASSQEMCSSAFPPPDTTSNLIEARRRLFEEDNRNKMKSKCASSSRNYHDASKTKFSKQCELLEDGFSHRKQSRKSYPAPMTDGCGMNISCSDVTVIGYSYGQQSVPYLSKFPGKNITLRQFKSLLSKKGNFRYFFKKASDDFGTGVVFEEITDDFDVLPLWEGKVFCVIESVDYSLS